MTSDQVLKNLDTYETILKRHRIKPVEVDMDLCLPGTGKSCSHALWMIPKIREQIAAGKTEKWNRWLGFIQATIWCAGFYSINEMKDHNRSEESVVNDDTVPADKD